VRVYGCVPPNPVSLHPEYLRLRFQIVWCMSDTSKNGATWYSVLRHYDAEDSGTPTDNLESIQEVVK